MDFNWADFAIIAIVLVSTVISLARGFVKEAVSLASWVCAAWVAFRYSPVVAEYLRASIDIASVRAGVAALALFIAVLVAGGLLNLVISGLVEKTGLSGTDRTLGAVFGVLRGVLVIGLLVLLAGLTPFPQDTWWRQSSLLPVLQQQVIAYKVYLPEQIAKNFDFNRGRPSSGALLAPAAAAAAS